MVIMRESTPHFRSEYTSILLRPLFTWLFGPISDDLWFGVHFYIRKAGHFTGYGLTALAFMRGWRWQWHYFYFRQQLKRRAAWMALCCTAVVASADELHQTYLASRTGEMQDVFLDSCGAAVMLGISLLWSRSHYRRQQLIEQLDAGKPA